MALQSYCATTVANTQATLFTVASGHEALVISIELFGGTNGGKVTFVRHNGSANAFTFDVPVPAGTYTMLECKGAYPASWSLKATGDAAGIQICVNADDVTTA